MKEKLNKSDFRAKFHLNEKEKMYILFNSNYDTQYMVKYDDKLNGKFKRIDIAIDDFKGEHVKLDWLLRKLQSRYYTSIFNSSFLEKI